MFNIENGCVSHRLSRALIFNIKNGCISHRLSRASISNINNGCASHRSSSAPTFGLTNRQWLHEPPPVGKLISILSRISTMAACATARPGQADFDPFPHSAKTV
jgi:hypothetical protein